MVHLISHCSKRHCQEPTNGFRSGRLRIRLHSDPLIELGLKLGIEPKTDCRTNSGTRASPRPRTLAST